MFLRKCKITFISHGSTIYSEDNRFNKKSDYPPLNENGYNEIKSITEFIKKRGLKTNKIYSSPALRCIQSAEIISEALKQDFETLNNLTNRNWGNWDGLTLNDLEKKYADKNAAINEFFASQPENGENLNDFNKRINKEISNIISDNIRGRVIIITHPLVIQAAIANALNISPENQYKIYIRPASASQISYYENWASLVYSDHVPV